MQVQDLSQNQKIASLTKLTRELEQSRSPQETLKTIQRRLGETYGIIARMMLSTRGLPEGQYRLVQLQMEGDPLFDIFEQASDASAPVRSGGVVAAIISRNEPQLIHEVDWSADPYFHQPLAEYRSLLAIPFDGGYLPMTWMIVLKRAPEQFTVGDLEEMMLRVALIGSLLQSQSLADQLARANQKIDRDARQVGELQRSLLPATLPQISGLEIAASYEPSGRAGGDLYDFFPIDEPSGDTGLDDTRGTGRWCIIIGDAAGHGLAAAVVMAIVQSVLRAHPEAIAGPADLLLHANHQLCRKDIGGFFTAFLAIYEPTSRQLTYAGAGHPYPLLQRASDRTVVPLDSVASYPLGIDGSETFEEATIRLEPGDTLLLYTDGITEARNLQRDMFEEPRLLRAFSETPDGPAELIAQLREAVQGFAQGHAPDDDQTLVVVRAV